MNTTQIRTLIHELMERFEVPGLIVAAARGGDPATFWVEGTDADGHLLDYRKSLFPVASITKLATALTVLRLVDRGALALDDPLLKYLPDAEAARDPGVTVRRLLSHTSGLPDDVSGELAQYAPGLAWAALAQACLRTPLEAPPFSRVQYSQVGYGLLAILVERITGTRFDIALLRLVLELVPIEGYLGEEPPYAPVKLADVRSSHTGTDLEPFNSRFWRSLMFPWAGLITNADGVIKLARAFRGIPTEFLPAELCAEATRNQAGDLGGGYGAPFLFPRSPWGLGPDLRGDKKPHWAPVEAGLDCFGHAGASGCVVWHAPRANLTWAILGTRTADNGWLLRGTPAIGKALIES